MKTFKATHPRTGKVVTRRSNSDYTHAVFHTDGRTTFHQSRSAADRTASRRTFGVVPAEEVTKESAPSKETNLPEGHCTVVVRGDGSQCGARAVTSFESRGKRYYECREHQSS